MTRESAGTNWEKGELIPQPTTHCTYDNGFLDGMINQHSLDCNKTHENLFL